MRWLDESALIVLLNELRRRPMLAGEEGLRLSLAGTQDKLPVVFSEGRVGLHQSNGGLQRLHQEDFRQAQGEWVSNSGYSGRRQATFFDLWAVAIMDKPQSWMNG